MQGSLLIDESEFVKRFPNQSGHQFFLTDTPANGVSGVSAALSRALQDSGFEVTPAVERLSALNAVQNTYLGTFQILGGLGLLLGSAGLGVVVLRNVFGGGFLWGDPIVRQMVMWSGFMGAAIAASQDRHISIDALTKFLKGRVKDLVHVITSLFAAVVCYYMAQAAWVFMQDERQSGGELISGIPSWIGLTIIPLGFWLLMVHFALNAIEHAGDAISPPPAEEAK